ncbi:hypothetical protein ACOME3_001972 [Neoechinorhynchus agilis]
MLVNLFGMTTITYNSIPQRLYSEEVLNYTGGKVNPSTYDAKWPEPDCAYLKTRANSSKTISSTNIRFPYDFEREAMVIPWEQYTTCPGRICYTGEYNTVIYRPEYDQMCRLSATIEKMTLQKGVITDTSGISQNLIKDCYFDYCGSPTLITLSGIAYGIIGRHKVPKCINVSFILPDQERNNWKLGIHDIKRIIERLV